MSLYKGKSQRGPLVFCGLWEYGGSWVEEISLLAVIGCTWRGWRWDGGLVDKWIEGLVKEDKRAKQEDKRI